MTEMGNKYGDCRWSLQGMAALVTGETKGIGRAIVEEPAALGARVHTCSRNEVHLNACLEEWVTGKGYHVTGSLCDVTARAQRTMLLETVSSKFNWETQHTSEVGPNIEKSEKITEIGDVKLFKVSICFKLMILYIRLRKCKG